MNVIFSANNNEEIYVLPIVPPNLELDIPRKNEEFETINSGTLNLIGTRGLKSLSIQSIFPTKNYNWIKKDATSNGWEYVNFFNKWADKRVPIRIIITTKDGLEVLNMACTVENFKHGIDKAGDIVYSLDLKEFRFVEVKQV